MTRHARNCTAGAVYTYHEKKKDAAASGYGTNSQRLGKNSLREFDCCCLSLQPCRNPVITKDGYLYDKESILQYILTKKKEYARKLKEYERQKQKKTEQSQQESATKELEYLKNFLEKSRTIVHNKDQKPKEEAGASTSVSNMANGRDKELPSFWIPSKTPDAKEEILTKPDKNIYCPMSGKVLKMKDLIPIKFTEVKDDSDKKSLIVKQARYMCPITHDVLNNSTPCAVIRPTGDVITMECYEKLIKKDMINPLDNSKLTEEDIIPLQRGRTGYAAANEDLEGKHKRPALQC
ncbi:unnamed protein product [Trichogramma brassicae]|uniref:Nitric oxide synthase-interacting protein homolog n=1 Tax=Trichogramma brassicae TaxID=86971 RepID=A0A6H5ILF5_9HYME|nr:unnamed protein product [Trichogramma brassicae]